VRSAMGAPQPVYTAPDGTHGMIVNGMFVTLKAAMPPMDAEDDPALGGDSGVDEAAEGEPPMDDGGDQYVGDMTPTNFEAMMTRILAPVLKMQELHKGVSDALGEFKGMLGGYATKDAGRASEIATLKAGIDTLTAKLAQLTGDQPAVTLPTEIEAALKSGGPQAPLDPQALPTPENPLQALAMQTAPELYRPQVAGYNGAAGWQLMPPKPPQPNTGGN
jgi:hypothetical protein